jgi:hypothetical protein
MPGIIRRVLSSVRYRLPVYREILQTRDHLSALRGELGDIKTMLALSAQELDVRHNPRYSDPRQLQRYAIQVNSQNGEDGIIHEIFRRIGAPNRVFVELGVGDGTQNNTAFLFSQGWSGYWIDATDSFVKVLERSGLRHPDYLKWLVSFITRENAALLLESLHVPKEFDLLSLDIDQNTYWVWKALRDFRPRVVVVEYNAAIPPEIDWKVEYSARRAFDGSLNYGASLKALENLGRELGYSLVGCEWIGANAFFVRNDAVTADFAAPFTAENHYEPARYKFLHTRGHRPAILDRQSGSESGSNTA